MTNFNDIIRRDGDYLLLKRDDRHINCFCFKIKINEHFRFTISDKADVYLDCRIKSESVDYYDSYEFKLIRAKNEQEAETFKKHCESLLDGEG